MNMAHFLKLLYYGVDGYLEFKKVKDFVSGIYKVKLA